MKQFNYYFNLSWHAVLSTRVVRTIMGTVTKKGLIEIHVSNTERGELRVHIGQCE